MPANGTASVSVTIPSGIANGSHTVYAIGSTGDQASAAINVNTGTGFFATGTYAGNGPMTARSLGSASTPRSSS